MEEDSTSDSKEKNEKLQELLLSPDSSEDHLARASQLAMLMPGYTKVLNSMALFQQAIAAAAANQANNSSSCSRSIKASPSRGSRPRKRPSESLPALLSISGEVGSNGVAVPLSSPGECSLNYYEEQSFPESHPGKTCAFCNLKERSLLGQGELLKIKVEESKMFLCISNEQQMSPSSKNSPVLKKKVKRPPPLEDLEGVGYAEEKDPGKIVDVNTGGSLFIIVEDENYPEKVIPRLQGKNGTRVLSSSFSADKGYTQLIMSYFFVDYLTLF